MLVLQICIRAEMLMDNFVQQGVASEALFGEYVLHDDSLKPQRVAAIDAFSTVFQTLIEDLRNSNLSSIQTNVYGQIIAIACQFLDAEAPWSSKALFQLATQLLDALAKHGNVSLPNLSAKFITSTLDQLIIMQQNGCPAVATALYYSLTNVRHPGLDGICPKAMPLILRVLDSASSRAKISVIRALQHLIREAPATEIRWFGGPVMEALLHDVRVGEPGDGIRASIAAAECCIDAVAAIDPSADGPNHIAVMERVIELLPLSYSEMQRTLCRLAAGLVNRMRISCVPFLKRLFPLLGAVAETPSRGAETVAALETIAALVKYCRIRMPAHARSLANVLNTVLSNGTQDEVGQIANSILNQMKEIVGIPEMEQAMEKAKQTAIETAIARERALQEQAEAHETDELSDEES